MGAVMLGVGDVSPLYSGTAWRACNVNDHDDITTFEHLMVRLHACQALASLDNHKRVKRAFGLAWLGLRELVGACFGSSRVSVF